MDAQPPNIGHSCECNSGFYSTGAGCVPDDCLGGATRVVGCTECDGTTVTACKACDAAGHFVLSAGEVRGSRGGLGGVLCMARATQPQCSGVTRWAPCCE